MILSIDCDVLHMLFFFVVVVESVPIDWTLGHFHNVMKRSSSGIAHPL